MDFRIKGLPADEFAHLAGMTDAQLRELGVQRVHVDHRSAVRGRTAGEQQHHREASHARAP